MLLSSSQCHLEVAFVRYPQRYRFIFKPAKIMPKNKQNSRAMALGMPKIQFSDG